MTKTTKQKTLMTFILSAIFLTSVGLYQQASADNPHTTLVATFGPSGDHPYSDVAASDPGTVAFTNPASLPGGYFDAVEPTFQGGGAAPTPDKSITLHAGGTPLSPMNIVKGYEEARFTFDGLQPENNYSITVEISDMDDFGLTEDAAGTMPLPETVFVTGNGVELGSAVAVVGGGTTQTITKTLELKAVSDASGVLVVGFNENFQWDPSVPSVWDTTTFFCTPTKIPCIPSQTGIRVETISLERLPPDWVGATDGDAEMKNKKTWILTATATDKVPRQTGELAGFGWLYEDWTPTDDEVDAFGITTHDADLNGDGKNDVRDSLQNKDGWHGHNFVFAPGAGHATLCVAEIADAPTSGISIKGDSIKVNLRDSQTHGDFVDDVGVGYAIIVEPLCGPTVPTADVVDPEILAALGVPGGLPLGIVLIS